MDIFKEEAIKEFKAKVMYIGAFVEGPLPKNNRIISEELPDKNPENGNHVTLFYLGSIPTISEELFDDIMNLPEGFTVTVAGYGFDGKNQGISVSSDEYDFGNIHLYGNTKAVPHITYSWNEANDGTPVKTGWLNFVEIPELAGTEIHLKIKAFLYSNEMINLQYFRDCSKGVIPPSSSDLS